MLNDFTFLSICSHATLRICLVTQPSPMMMAVKRESSFSTPNGSAGNNSERITYRDTPSPENSQGSQGSRDSSPMTLPGSEEVTGTTEDYRCRKDTGKVIVRSNPTLGIRGEFEPSDRNPLGLRCAVETNENDFENKSERYRFMFTTLEERARAFEKHMMTMQEAMCELASIDPENLTSVGVPSQDAVWVCGRVCCDSEGKINNTSVLLEGSKRESAGRRVRLDLQVLHCKIRPNSVQCSVKGSTCCPVWHRIIMLLHICLPTNMMEMLAVTPCKILLSI